MKQNALLAPVLLFTLAMGACDGGGTEAVLHAAMPEVRLMNVNNVLSAYGMTQGFVRGSPIIRNIPFSRMVEFGPIENNPSIDTPEEFITAAFYSPIEVSASARAAINRELPQGREGALRLGAMWLKKSAEMPQNAGAYQRALSMIMQRSGVSEREIREYYVRIMTDTINAAGQRYLGRYYTREQLVNTICRPLVEYYSNPTTSNYNTLVQTGGSLGRERDNRMVHFLAMIRLLDPIYEFRHRVTEDIFSYGRQVAGSAR